MAMLALLLIMPYLVAQNNLSMTAKQLDLGTHRFSIEAYHRMGEANVFEGQKVELLCGKIFDMSPINSKHAGLVKHLNRLLNEALGAAFIVSVQDPVQIAPDSEPEPDLAVLRYREDWYAHAHPKPKDVLLIIEVAESSLEKDRKVKLPLYASAGIRETWLVNLPERQIEQYLSPSETGYKHTQIWRPGDFAEAVDGLLRLEVGVVFGVLD